MARWCENCWRRSAAIFGSFSTVRFCIYLGHKELQFRKTGVALHARAPGAMLGRAASAVPFGYFLHRRWHGHAHALEDVARASLQFTPQQIMPPTLGYFHVLHPLKIANNVGPLEMLA